MYKKIFKISLLAITFLVLFSKPALAVNFSADTFYNVYKNGFKEISETIIPITKRLFWALALLSFGWKMSFEILAKADLSKILGYLLRFAVVTGIYYFFLTNNVQIVDKIVNTAIESGAIAGAPRNLSPAFLLDKGMELLKSILDNHPGWLNWRGQLAHLMLTFAAIGNLIILSLIYINYIFLYISLWIFAYCGIILLGFSGAHWTQDVVISYFKSVIGLSLELLCLLLIVNLANRSIISIVSKDVRIEDVIMLTTGSLVLMLLTSLLPKFFSEIFNSFSIKHVTVSDLIRGSTVAIPLSYYATKGTIKLATKPLRKAIRLSIPPIKRLINSYIGD